LPEALVIGAFDDEDVEFRRMDHDENGFGDFRRLVVEHVDGARIFCDTANDCNSKNEKGAIGVMPFS
jgi:hypothetical protein